MIPSSWLRRNDGLLRITACLLVVAGVAVSETFAAAFPSRSIRMIVPVAAGGPTDLLARTMTPKLSESLGQQVVVDNRAGGNGNIGMGIAARAEPDGQTWVLATAGHLTVNPALYKNLPFDTLRDFAPISICANLPSILVTHPTVPVKSVTELVRLGKAQPGYLVYSTAGVGSPSHLSGELLKSLTGISFVNIHHKGGAPAMLDVMSGQAHFSILGLPTVLPHVRTGKLRSLGVTTRNRLPAAPDLATVHESGLAGFEVTNWLAMAVPARVPPDVVSRINKEVVAVLKRPDVRDALTQQGFTPVGSTPNEMANYLRSEVARWSKVVKDAKITGE